VNLWLLNNVQGLLAVLGGDLRCLCLYSIRCRYPGRGIESSMAVSLLAPGASGGPALRLLYKLLAVT